MTTLPRDPLTGTDRLLIDGTNLLHALSRKPGAAPQAALIGRLRAIVPAAIGIELVFDGAPDRGMRGERVAAGTDRPPRRSAHRRRGAALAGGRDAGRRGSGRDRRPARGQRRPRAPGVAARQGCADGRARRGCSVGSSGRSCRRRPSAIAGRPRLARSRSATRPRNRQRWKPGRGATTKRGNPRRGRPSSGSMPS